MATTNNQSPLNRAATIARRTVGAITTSGPLSVQLPLPDAIEAAQAGRRRDAIHALYEHDEPQMQLSALADVLARQEFGDDFTSQERKRIYVGMYQSHLSTLEELDLIYTVEGDSNTIVTTERLDAVKEWLDDGAERFTGGDA